MPIKLWFLLCAAGGGCDKIVSIMAKDPLEVLWNKILSRNAKQVRAAYASLDPASQTEVLQHLQRMATEDGWHPEQRKSAEAALAALTMPHTKEQ